MSRNKSNTKSGWRKKAKEFRKEQNRRAARNRLRRHLFVIGVPEPSRKELLDRFDKGEKITEEEIQNALDNAFGDDGYDKYVGDALAELEAAEVREDERRQMGFSDD